MKTASLNQTNRPSRTFLVTTACGFLMATATQPAHGQMNPGILDPTNTYAGKTYNEWSAAWWQYYMSLPATNNPFNQSPAYPRAPLSTGQSGPVWFLGGNYLPDGSYRYTNTVPGGIALFTMIATIERDNTGCPTNWYTEQELRGFAKSVEDGATNLTCTIDGVAVTGLSNVLTTPYRIQSPAFSYTCPSIHNVLDDVFGRTCYRTNTGTPYLISGAVEDGVFLMITPPSAGSHTIHVTRSFPAVPYDETYTYYLTVQQVALIASLSSQSANLTLSWPQTPDNYTIETSPDLFPTNWQPTNLSVTLTGNKKQASVPVGTNSQFFRLRLQ